MDKTVNNFNVPELGDLYKLSHWVENEHNTERMFAEVKAREDNFDLAIQNLTNGKLVLDTEMLSLRNSVANAITRADNSTVLAQSAADKAIQVENELRAHSLQMAPIIEAANATASAIQSLEVRVQEGYTLIGLNTARIEEVRNELNTRINNFISQYNTNTYIIVDVLPDKVLADKRVFYCLDRGNDIYDTYIIDQSGNALEWVCISSTDYNIMSNKPMINGVTLEGNKSFEDLGLLRITEIDIDESFLLV